jgi:hypothetical protein
LVLPLLNSNQRQRILFVIGVEFPSEKMQKNFNRGMTLREISDFIKLLRDNGMSLCCSYLSRIPDLDKEDLKEAVVFFKEINAYSDSSIIHTIGAWLKPDPPGEPQKIMGITYGYLFDLDKESQAINNEWLAMFDTLPHYIRRAKVVL